MKGHIRRRGATWACYFERPRDPLTGKRRKATKGGFKTKQEAQRWLNKTLTELQEGRFVEPSKVTLGEFLREWHAGGKARGLRRTTLVGYEVAIEKWIIPQLGAVPLAQLTPGHLNACYSALLEDGRTQGEGGLSPRTVRIAHSVIRRALKDAVRWRKAGPQRRGRG
jgi:hypothetical protein